MSSPLHLKPAELRPFFAVDDRASARAVAFDVVSIVGAIALSEALGTWWAALLAVVVIGARQHALLILMHEAAHKGLLSDRRRNEWVGELVLAWPFFVTMARYREKHMAHHRFLNTPADPDWVFTHDDAQEGADWRFPMPARRVAGLLFADLVGLGTLNLLGKMRRYSGAPRSRRGKRWRAPLYLLAAAALLFTGTWAGFLLYWLVPMLTVLKALLRLRLMAEHFGLPEGDGTRTVLTNALGRFFLAPHGINFHVEHHRFPAVRFLHLPRLHALLVERGAYARVQPTQGYGRMLLELVR